MSIIFRQRHVGFSYTNKFLIIKERKTSAAVKYERMTRAAPTAERKLESNTCISFSTSTSKARYAFKAIYPAIKAFYSTAAKTVPYHSNEILSHLIVRSKNDYYA